MRRQLEVLYVEKRGEAGDVADPDRNRVIRSDIQMVGRPVSYKILGSGVIETPRGHRDGILALYRGLELVLISRGKLKSLSGSDSRKIAVTINVLLRTVGFCQCYSGGIPCVEAYAEPRINP